MWTFKGRKSTKFQYKIKPNPYFYQIEKDIRIYDLITGPKQFQIAFRCNTL